MCVGARVFVEHLAALPVSFLVFFFFNSATIAEVIAIDNYEPNRELISKSFPCTSWLSLTCPNITNRSIDKAYLVAAGWGAVGSDPTLISSETC